MAGCANLKLVVVIVGLSLAALAQAPALIRVPRNLSPPDLSPACIQPYADAKTAVMVLAMTSVSGVSETWLAEAHDSFESIEYVDKALAGFAPSRNAAYPTADDVLPPSRTLIALYRPGLSYRPDEAVKNLPKARYLLISIYRIRPGSDAGFAELVRLRRARFDSINLDRPEIGYQVMTGAPSRTYLFFAPLNSLKTLTPAMARPPPYAEGVRETVATAGQKIAAESEIGHEFLLFRIEPRFSYVSEEFAAVDPDFWSPKQH